MFSLLVVENMSTLYTGRKYVSFYVLVENMSVENVSVENVSVKNMSVEKMSRCRAWDSNHGPQDGRRRQSHRAMAAALSLLNFHGAIMLANLLLHPLSTPIGSEF